MNDNIVKLITLVTAIISISTFILIFIYKWLDSVSRNPESSDKLSTIGFIAVGVFEPTLLVIIGCIFYMVK